MRPVWVSLHESRDADRDARRATVRPQRPRVVRRRYAGETTTFPRFHMHYFYGLKKGPDIRGAGGAL